jgi:hypothetical protein
MARLLGSLGAMLVMLGLAAHLFGWDALLSIPLAALDAVRADPETYGVVAVGVLLMLVARLIGGRRG